MPTVTDRIVEGFRQRVKLRLAVAVNELKQDMLAALASHIDEAVSRALADEIETLVAVHLSSTGDQLVIQLDRSVPPSSPVAPVPVDAVPVDAAPTSVESSTPVVTPVETPAPPSDPAPVSPATATPSADSQPSILGGRP